MRTLVGGALGLLLLVSALGCNPQPTHVVIEQYQPVGTPRPFICKYRESYHSYGCLQDS